MTILVFIGLIFVISYVREANVANQLELEFLHHMNQRYVNGISYQILDSIQRSYQCCDPLWYRANADGVVPLSCFANVPNPFPESCPIVLGRLVSLRCKIISISLVVILISLISLIIIGICELMGQEYHVANREEYYRRMKAADQSTGHKQVRDGNLLDQPEDVVISPISASNLSSKSSRTPTPHIDDDIIGDEISDRLKLDEREREIPLLTGRAKSPSSHYVGGGQKYERRTERPAPILTRANFTSIDNHRTHSPTIVDTHSDRSNTRRNIDDQSFANRPRSNTHQNKSSLKRTPSNGSIEHLDIEPDESESEVHEYMREVQTRRSSMNVRFNIK